jgi:Fe-S oxidoreductase
VTEKLFNDLKTILLFRLQLISINILQFVKIIEGTKIVFSCGSCFDYMIELSEDLLNDIIYSDYKQVLFLLQFERLDLARQLAVEVVT